ncbi:MAG: lipid A deacylase LpxR family protein [Cyclobacteriaceae bacterium]
MNRSVLFISFILLLNGLIAQEKSAREYLKFDYQLVVDNDVFTLDLKKDRFYSSGIYGAVRMLLDSTESGAKVIRSYQLNQQMYTPTQVRWTRIEQLDRPYAGVMSITGSNEYYLPNNAYYKASVELGILGPASMVGRAQETWHGWFGMPEPKGWKFQIENTPVVNLYLTRVKPFFSSYNLDMSNVTVGSMGTIYNNIKHEVLLRVGELRPMNQSAFTSSSLGRKFSETRELKEFYMFYAPGVEYVFQNATLQGSLFSKNSPHTVDVIHWVWHHRFGMMWSWSRFDAGFTAFWRSPENETAIKHKYVGIRLNQRF